MKTTIAWKLPGSRDRLYAAINLVTGPCVTREYSMTKAELGAVQDILRAAGFPLPEGDKSGAIGMQHRWCMTTQDIKDLGQLRLMMTNRLAAVRANYLPMDFAAACFEENGFDPSIRRLIQGHKAGILPEDEVILLLEHRKAHPLFKM